MPQCNFCRKQYEFPYGTTIVGNDNVARYYCSNKCIKNTKMGRSNKKVKWITKDKEAIAALEKKKAWLHLGLTLVKYSKFI